MNKRTPILLGILLVLLASWLLVAPSKPIRAVMERLDNIGYDIQLRTRVLTDKSALKNVPVAIIDIDDQSLKAVGRWPWPRSKLAELTEKLQKQGAAVIAFDIFFSERESNMAAAVLKKFSEKNLLTPTLESSLKNNEALFNEDDIFAKALSSSSTVLALGFLPRKQQQNELPPPLIVLTPEEEKQLEIINAAGYISNIPILQQAAKKAGFINIFADSDGIVRRAPLLIQFEGKVYPSLSLQAVLSFLGEEVELITPSYGDFKMVEGIKIGNSVIPTDANAQVLIPFIGKSYTFPFYSALDVLKETLPADALLGKIVFIGTSATGLGDLQATAIENPFPGVEVQATLVNGLLKNNFSYQPEWTLGANLILVFLFGLFASFSFPYMGPRTLGAIVIFLPPALLFINNWFWLQTGLILSLLLPVILVLVIAILNIIYGYLFETRRRERLKGMFGQYVPAKHIDEMLQTTSDYGLRGEDRDMSVLFADIRNFTTISEGMSAAELVTMLNTFFTPMTEAIFKHRGTIDKYVGDLIMAFWGAPLRDKNHTRHALESALEMQNKLNDLRKAFAEKKWPEINIGIGINSGTMSVGDMGSRFRRNYTVLGDAVNLASRVEGLTKFYGVNIIVTEHAQTEQTRFVFRKLDRVTVKGKHKSITIYELVCTQNDITPELSTELSLYHQALDHYFAQQWDTALVEMKELQQRFPDKKIYEIYITRIEEFKRHPVPADWDGVYAHAGK